MDEIKILGIVGSLLKGVHNRFALKAAQRFDQKGRLTDEPTRQLIQKLLAALAQLVKISPSRKSQAD